MDNHKIFLYAIEKKEVVELTFESKEKGVITRECIPFDFGPSRRNLKINPSKYHFYDLDSPKGAHPLPVLPEQVIKIKLLDKTFDPANYITWEPPYNWHIQRDWGAYS